MKTDFQRIPIQNLIACVTLLSRHADGMSVRRLWIDKCFERILNLCLSAILSSEIYCYHHYGHVHIFIIKSILHFKFLPDCCRKAKSVWSDASTIVRLHMSSPDNHILVFDSVALPSRSSAIPSTAWPWRLHIQRSTPNRTLMISNSCIYWWLELILLRLTCSIFTLPTQKLVGY